MFAKGLVFSLVLPMALAGASFCLHLPKINLNGGTYDEFTAVDIHGCCVRCHKDPCCIGYTYDTVGKKCYMKSAITYSNSDFTKTSGLKTNNKNGRASVLRNVKIEGVSAVGIKLPNSEDCQHYCSAYDIFSWSPTHSKDEISGECSCMTRVSSIEYSYGSKSAILASSSIK
ncbi:hypothetical protein QR680_001802 [Steinernema hermaphroditum]|uniref:Apple domain-containing protein n=1 Tax=Steinernema hermaphroditum TaxID=289476 RepID=A0AA39GZY5_9BILA|nr:hypothetical protein QR680_001802 [Steinernema hermaphroditum]